MEVKEKFDQEMKNYFEAKKICLGSYTSEGMRNDPKHLGFVLARYKFVAKMLEGQDYVLEVGCGDAFGLPIVAQSVKKLYAVDWEDKFICDNANRLSFLKNVDFIQNDINKTSVENVKVNAIYNIDFIEHLDPTCEAAVMENMIESFICKEKAVMIIGTPNLSASQYASPKSAALHINLKSFDTLKSLLNRYFQNVFMFGMNDEVLHTGYAPMCQYIFGMGVGLK